MARQSRIHYAGALYHIIARGNNREAVFHDGDDKSKYLALVERYKQKYQFHLYAYNKVVDSDELKCLVEKISKQFV